MKLLGLYIEWQENFNKCFFVWTFSSRDFHLLVRIACISNFVQGARKTVDLWVCQMKWSFVDEQETPTTAVSSETLTEVSEIKIFATMS